MLAPLRLFEPSLERGRALTGAVRASLKESLEHLSAACEPVLPEVTGYLANPLDILRAGLPLPPEAFGSYFELGEALLGGDNERATNAARLLSGISPGSAELAFHRRGSSGAALLDKVLDQRCGDEAFGFAPIPEPLFLEFRELVNEGLDLLRRGFPDLHGEITAIISDLLFAQAPEGALMEFDGASHYQFWGLLILNPKHHRTPLAVAEVLAHESGHSLLFGLTIDEPLVFNPDEELYPSPLRIDPRPMDGIYHATYVSARMALAMETLAGSGFLTPEEGDWAEKAAEKDRHHFATGLKTIEEHGQLSETGREILDHARRWVG
jgi:HEXXH motif-containing protein